MKFIKKILVACLLVFTGLLQAAEVSVAVAANFTAPMKQIAAAFANETGHQARLSFGATGKFYAQIQHGAPFEILLAADAATPARLVEEGMGIAETHFTYARGSLVLWSLQEGLIDAEATILRQGNYQKLAIANPRLAPYGAAAMEVLQKLGLREQATNRLVQGENIGQTYQFAYSGNAELGFVALSQVMKDGKLQQGSAWIVPQELYTPILQNAVLLQNGKDNTAARELLEFLQGQQARDIMHSYGYGIP